MILKAFMTFTKKLSSSPKNVVRNVFELVQKDCRSITGSNLRNIKLECSSDQHRPFSSIDIEKKDLFPTPQDAARKVPLIREMIEMRDDQKDKAGWKNEEIISTL